MKKKLPTTPNIAPMTVHTGHGDDKSHSKTETAKKESANIESRKQENRTKESVSTESLMTESLMTDSSIQDQEGKQSQSVKQSGLPEKTKQLKTVTMRITNSAADVLRDLKTETGLPNEILTDALIRNWEKIPKKLQQAIIEDAKRIRAWRLVEGKRKSLETAQRNNPL